MADVIVTGVHGMLGHVVCRVLMDNHRVVGVCRAPRATYASPDWMRGPRFSLLDQVDLTDPRALARNLPARGVSVVVNCAGLIKQRPEASDPLTVLQANALVPQRLARWCDAHGARLIHISTDCVFSGRRGGYSEADIPDPVDLYGLSKLVGEIATAPHLTLRTSFIGPQLRGREGLLGWFLAQRGRTVQGYTNAVFSGLTTLAFAQVVDHIVSDPSGLHGLYHVASPPISKYALLCEIERRLALGITILRDGSVACDRSLDGTRFAADSGIAIPDWKTMLDALLGNSNGGVATWTAPKSPTTVSPTSTFS